MAFGAAARIAQKVVETARKEGIKVGLFRPITLYPYPYKRLNTYKNKLKGILTVELNAGQMIEDVRLAVDCSVPVAHFGRMGGIIPTPQEVYEALKELSLKELSSRA